MWSWVSPRILSFCCLPCPFPWGGIKSTHRFTPYGWTSLWGAGVLDDMIDSFISFLQQDVAPLTDELTHWNGANWQSSLGGLWCTHTQVIAYVWGYREAVQKVLNQPQAGSNLLGSPITGTWCRPDGAAFPHSLPDRSSLLFLRNVILCSILSELHLIYQIWSQSDQICEI